MKEKHAQKNFGAVGAMAPTPVSLKTRGGGGVLHTRTGPGRPLRASPFRLFGCKNFSSYYMRGVAQHATITDSLFSAKAPSYKTFDYTRDKENHQDVQDY